MNGIEDYHKATKSLLQNAKNRIADPADYSRINAAPMAGRPETEALTKTGEGVPGYDSHAASWGIAGALSWAQMTTGKGNAATYNAARTAIARAGDTLYELLAEDCRRSGLDIDILEEIEAARLVDGDFEGRTSLTTLLRKMSGVCSHQTAMKLFDLAVDDVEWESEANNGVPARPRPAPGRSRRKRSRIQQIKHLANHVRGISTPGPSGESRREALEATGQMLTMRQASIEAEVEPQPEVDERERETEEPLGGTVTPNDPRRI